MNHKHHSQNQPPSQTEYHGHYEHQQQLAVAPTEHTGHDKHAGHSPDLFKRRFFICLLLTLPILYFAPHFQDWFAYQAIQLLGVRWVDPVLATVIYFYGGWVFVKGAWYELRSKIGMMTLIALPHCRQTLQCGSYFRTGGRIVLLGIGNAGRCDAVGTLD